MVRELPEVMVAATAVVAVVAQLAPTLAEQAVTAERQVEVAAEAVLLRQEAIQHQAQEPEAKSESIVGR